MSIFLPGQSHICFPRTAFNATVVSCKDKHVQDRVTLTFDCFISLSATTAWTDEGIQKEEKATFTVLFVWDCFLVSREKNAKHVLVNMWNTKMLTASSRQLCSELLAELRLIASPRCLEGNTSWPLVPPQQSFEINAAIYYPTAIVAVESSVWNHSQKGITCWHAASCSIRPKWHRTSSFDPFLSPIYSENCYVLVSGFSYKRFANSI